MVYLTQEELGWRPYVQSWVERKFGLITREINGVEHQIEILDADKRKFLLGLYDQYIDDVLK